MHISKTLSWIIVLFLIVSASFSVFAQEKPGTTQTEKTQTGTAITEEIDDYSNPDFYQTTDPSTWDPAKVDFNKIPPEKMTARILVYGDNLVKAGNLGKYPAGEISKALAEKYNNVDVTISSAAKEVTVDSKGIADNNGIKIDFTQFKSTDKIEAIQGGWTINGVKFTGTGNLQVGVTENGEFSVDANSEDSATVEGASKGTVNAAKSINIEVLSGSIDISKLKIKADDAIINGADAKGNQFEFKGRGEINFNDAGNIVTARLDSYNEKQTTFSYLGTTAATSGQTATVFTDANAFQKAKGNDAFISENAIATRGILNLKRNDLIVTSDNAFAAMSFKDLVDGTSVTTSKGKIIIEDKNSKFTGMQDSTVMKKETKLTTSNKPADFYSIDGNNGNIAAVEKKLAIGALIGANLVEETESLGITTLINKESGKIIVGIDNKQLLQLAQTMKDPSAIALFDKEMYIEAGKQKYFGINSDGMGRLESPDGKISTSIFPPAKVQSLLGSPIVLITSSETEQIQKLASLDPAMLKTIDINALKENTALLAYVERNLPIDLNKLESALANPNSAESQKYFELISLAKVQRDQGLQQLADAEKLSGEQQQAAIIAAKKKLLQAVINANIANGKNVEDLVKQRTAIEFYEKAADANNLPIEQRASALRALKNNPEFKEFASTELAKVFAEQAVNKIKTTEVNRMSQAMINLKLALDNDPNNKQIIQAKNDMELALLKIISSGVASARESQFKELEAKAEVSDSYNIFKSWIQFKTWATVGVSESASAIAGYNNYLAEVASAEQIDLAKEKTGVDMIAILRERGYSWEQIKEASKDPIKTGTLFNTKDSKTNAMLQENLAKGLSNPDVKKVITPTGQIFDFESGKSYADSSFLEGYGDWREKLYGASNLLTNVVSIGLLAPSAVIGSSAIAGLRVSTQLGGKTLLEAASAIKIGGRVGEIGDGIIAGVSKATTSARDLINVERFGVNTAVRLSKEVSKAETELLSLQRTLRAAEAAKDEITIAELTPKVAAAQVKFDQALLNAKSTGAAADFFASVKEGYANLESGVVSRIEQTPIINRVLFTGKTRAELVHAAMKETTVVIGGEAYVIDESVKDAVRLKNVLTSEIRTIKTAEEASAIQIIKNNKFDEETTNIVRSLFSEDSAAQTAKLSMELANSKRGFNGFPESNIEADDLLRYGKFQPDNVKNEIEQMAEVKKQLTSVKTAGTKISSASSDEISAIASETKENLLDLTEQAHKQKLTGENTIAYYAQIAKTGEEAGVVELSGDTLKALNKIQSGVGNDGIQAFKNGVKPILGEDVTIAVEQKQVIITGKSVNAGELKQAMDNGLENVNQYLIKTKRSVPVSGRVGKSTIEPIAGFTDEEAALIARKKAEIAGQLAESEGGRFGNTYNKEMDDYILSLSPDKRAELLRGVPQGKSPNFAELQRRTEQVNNELDTLISDLNSGKINKAEFEAAYQANVQPLTSDLEGIIYSHEKFNKLNGVEESVLGRNSWFAQNAETIRSGDYVIAFDVNNMGKTDLNLLTQKLTQLEGSDLNAQIKAASIMGDNIADQELVKMFNTVQKNVVDKFIQQGVAEGKFTAAEARGFVSAAAGDEGLTSISKKVGDYIIETTGKPPAEIIRETIEQTTNIRVSVGQTTFRTGETMTSSISRSDEALNAAKDVNKIPGKNAAAVVSEDGLTIKIVTPGKEYETLTFEGKTLRAETIDEFIESTVLTGTEALGITSTSLALAED